jgi:hypothetical protein
MSSIQSTSFNWLPRQSAWQSIQAWHAKQQSYQAQFESLVASASDIFGSAMVNLGTGMATIAAQRASDRIRAQMSAKVTGTNQAMAAGSAALDVLA